MSASSGSVLSSSGSGGREREKKPEGHQDTSGGSLPQPVACHPTPTALLPLILPAESPHPAPRKQIIMGRPGTGKEERGEGSGKSLWHCGCDLCSCQIQSLLSLMRYCGMCRLYLMYSSLVLLAFIISLELQECHQSALDMTHVYFTIVCLQCKK